MWQASFLTDCNKFSTFYGPDIGDQLVSLKRQCAATIALPKMIQAIITARCDGPATTAANSEDYCAEAANTCDGGCCNGGMCHNTQLGYECECAPGWSGRTCQAGAVTACDNTPCECANLSLIGHSGYATPQEETAQHCSY